LPEGVERVVAEYDHGILEASRGQKAAAHELDRVVHVDVELAETERARRCERAQVRMACTACKFARAKSVIT